MSNSLRLVVHLMADRVRLLAAQVDRRTVVVTGTAELERDLRGGANGELTNELFRLLERFSLERGLRRPRVVAGVSRELLVWRTFRVPPVEREDLDPLVGFELEKHLPVKREEVMLRWLPLERTAEGWSILLVATRRDVVQSLQDALRMLGLSLGALVPDTEGLEAILAGAEDDDGDRLLALVDGDHAEGVVRRAGLPRLHRVLALPPSAEPPAQPAAIVAEWLASLLAEEAGGGAPITRGVVLVAGGGADLVRQRLESLPGTTWRVLRPDDLTTLRTPEGMTFGKRLPVTAGLAFAASGGGPSDLDLLPRPEIKRSAPSYRLTFALAAILLAMSLGLLALADHRRQGEIAAVDGEIAALRGKVGEVLALGDQMRSEEKRLGALEKVVAHRTLVIDLLRELTRVIPSTAYLTQCTLRKGGLELVGMADKASDLINVLEASPLFRNVAFDGPITAQGTRERFKIKCTLENG